MVRPRFNGPFVIGFGYAPQKQPDLYYQDNHVGVFEQFARDVARPVARQVDPAPGCDLNGEIGRGPGVQGECARRGNGDGIYFSVRQLLFENAFPDDRSAEVARAHEQDILSHWNQFR